MARLTIEKFVNGQHEKTIRIPTAVVKAGAALLPKSAIDALAEEGLNVADILEAMKRGTPYTASLDVCEQGVERRVTVSLAGAS